MVEFDRFQEDGRGGWGKIFQKHAAAAARHSRDLNVETRLMLAAVSRANNAGHAIFNDGELGAILAKNQTDGTVKPLSRSSQYVYIKRLVSAGLAVEGSNPNCVWLPWELWERKRHGTAFCPVHSSRATGSALTPGWTPSVVEDVVTAEADAASSPAPVLESWTPNPGFSENPEF